MNTIQQERMVLDRSKNYLGGENPLMLMVYRWEKLAQLHIHYYTLQRCEFNNALPSIMPYQQCPKESYKCAISENCTSILFRFIPSSNLSDFSLCNFFLFLVHCGGSYL